MTPRIITLKELNQHNKSQDLWISIADKVYDCSVFADMHPGGEEVILDKAGTFATDVFEDVGHSTDAREMMEQYCIGVMADDDKEKKCKAEANTESKKSSLVGILVPLGIAAAAAVIYRLVTQHS